LWSIARRVRALRPGSGRTAPSVQSPFPRPAGRIRCRSRTGCSCPAIAPCGLCGKRQGVPSWRVRLHREIHVASTTHSGPLEPIRPVSGCGHSCRQTIVRPQASHMASRSPPPSASQPKPFRTPRRRVGPAVYREKILLAHCKTSISAARSIFSAENLLLEGVGTIQGGRTVRQCSDAPFRLQPSALMLVCIPIRPESTA
jgi:hypothetical protein